MENLDEYYDYSWLPYHIISKILSYLKWNDFTNAVQTCKPFYHASYDITITKHLLLKVNPDLKNLSLIFRPFSQLILSGINFDKFSYLSFFGKFGHHIKIISFNGCNISLVQLLEIFSFLVNLIEIKLNPKTETFDSANFASTEFCSMKLLKLSNNLANIRVLELYSHSSNFRGLEAILKHTINLNTLTFNCHWDFNFNIRTLLSIMQGWNSNNLRYLEINYMQNSKEQCSAFFQIFSKLKQNKLIHLQLNDLSNLYHDKYFTRFCENHSKLQVLKIQQCNEKQMNDVCRYMKTLRVLVLGGLVTSSLKDIGNLTYLEKLHLYKNTSSLLRDHGVVHQLFENNFKFLTVLDISFPVAYLNLINLCNRCHQLQHLKLRQLQTKYCYPIFKNLVNLKSLLIYFDEIHEPTCLLEDVNILTLQSLEKLEINEYAIGISPHLIEQLPKLIDGYFLRSRKISTRTCYRNSTKQNTKIG